MAKNFTEQIIKKCKERGIEINKSDSYLMDFINSFDEMPDIRESIFDKSKTVISKNTSHWLKELIIEKDGKYTTSSGSGIM
jgi:hypothetical protein